MFTNLYVHFPFCRNKCSYCALYSRVGSSAAARSEYVAAVAKEIAKLADMAGGSGGTGATGDAGTVYFGGGSPALCDLSPLAPALASLLSKSPATSYQLTTNNYRLTTNNYEFTVELHPLDVTPAKLDELESVGVNRISMGVQSLDDDVLRAMGRGYTADEAERAFSLVKSRFDNAGIDLIIGYPGDSVKWIDRLAGWGMKHCSAYSLQNERGLKDVPGDDKVLDEIRTVAAFLKSIGLERYEISNYAVPGFECRHNLAVWRGEDYVGLGEGACGRVGFTRTRGVKAGGAAVAFDTSVSSVTPEFDLKERTMFRLRTREGLDASRFPEWIPTLERFVEEGLLTETAAWGHAPLLGHPLRGQPAAGGYALPDVYYLTERGTEVCDFILAELV